MILKGNARAGADNLAKHLLNTQDNDRVEVAEIRGVAAEDFNGALKDMEAVASGTRCEKFFYSLSINPSQPLTREEYATAIDRIEDELGLTGQARAVVFHHKKSQATGESREHAHVVWSRIDENTMTARQLSFDRQKLRGLSRELAQEFGLEVPKNISNDRGVERFNDRFNKQSYAEKGQMQRSGLNPAERKEKITAAYYAADSGRAFMSALEESGFYIARGDKRGLVVVDLGGEVHSLSRQIEGAKAKDVRAKIEDIITPEQLPGVDKAKEFIAQRQRARAEAEQEKVYAGTLNNRPAQQGRHDELARTQAAELKAVNGKFKTLRKDATARETAALDNIKRETHDVFKPQWRSLLQRQEFERGELKEARRDALGRLTYFLKNPDMMRFHEDGKGILAHGFKFVALGQGDEVEKHLAKRQQKERRELGRQEQREAKERGRDIKAEFSQYRAELSRDQSQQVRDLKDNHRLQTLDSQRQRDKVEQREGNEAFQPHYKKEQKRAERDQNTLVSKYADIERDTPAPSATRAERKAEALREMKEARNMRPDFNRSR